MAETVGKIIHQGVVYADMEKVSSLETKTNSLVTQLGSNKIKTLTENAYQTLVNSGAVESDTIYVTY